jgi:hypothetical protein
MILSSDIPFQSFADRDMYMQFLGGGVGHICLGSLTHSSVEGDDNEHKDKQTDFEEDEEAIAEEDSGESKDDEEMDDESEQTEQTDSDLNEDVGFDF